MGLWIALIVPMKANHSVDVPLLQPLSPQGNLQVQYVHWKTAAASFQKTYRTQLRHFTNLIPAGHFKKDRMLLHIPTSFTNANRNIRSKEIQPTFAWMVDGAANTQCANNTVPLYH